MWLVILFKPAGLPVVNGLVFTLIVATADEDSSTLRPAIGVYKFMDERFYPLSLAHFILACLQKAWG